MVLFLVLLAAAPLGTAAQTRVPSVEPAPPSFSHIFVIVLENREMAMIGNPTLPYLTTWRNVMGWPPLRTPSRIQVCLTTLR